MFTFIRAATCEDTAPGMGVYSTRIGTVRHAIQHVRTKLARNKNPNTPAAVGTNHALSLAKSSRKPPEPSSDMHCPSGAAVS
eukprot:2072648-Rhodomonas_salina.1